jgi:hypothetical protein
MKKLADVLVAAFTARVEKAGVARAGRAEALKWLRFYLDFCAKYRHPPRDRDSLDPFLQKLTEKGQSLASQKRAAWSGKKYQELMESWGNQGGACGEETHGECAA